MPSLAGTFEVHESGAEQPVLDIALSITSLQKAPHDNGSFDVPDGNARSHYSARVRNKSQMSSYKSESLALNEESRGTRPVDEDQQPSLFNQVYEWLMDEKTRHKRHQAILAQADRNNTPVTCDISLSLDQLEDILTRYSFSRDAAVGSNHPARRTRRRVKGLRSGSASDSEHTEFELGVPNVETTLNNSSLVYSSGAGDGSVMSVRAEDSESWLAFKREVIRLTHTMRIKGWRRVSMESAGDIDVVRLSGALTNAVYVVTPPKVHLKSDNTAMVSRKSIQKLLLRIYGPQADHLIDRENELHILRRLGRKNIGPRVLGTFNNGRIEEYFEAHPLTASDLRVPETSKHIAKRMRELHDYVELLPEERDGGPMVFRNWDKWVDRCEQVASWLDKELQSQHNETKAQSEPWRRRGFVCGVPWPVFRKNVDSYRKWLTANCGGTHEIRKQLVFAHNDAQYGNLLRMEPKGESPLLFPANEHKQLVVIDFEYASANTPGLEFANHFTEWCYNYHDPEKPWACCCANYPTPEEQHRFISAYLSHRTGAGQPESQPASPSLQGTHGTPTPSFHLDGAADSNSLAQEAELAAENREEVEVQRLMKQQRLWRVMNSALWIAWGIVQAKVPGLEEGIVSETEGRKPNNVGTSLELEGEEALEADGFDYLSYAHDRAMFFWADLLALKFTDESELPRELVESIKPRIVEY